jgi:hypothetical protein
LPIHIKIQDQTTTQPYETKKIKAQFRGKDKNLARRMDNRIKANTNWDEVLKKYPSSLAEALKIPLVT